MKVIYRIIYWLIWPFFNLIYPTRCIGRENLPESAAVICANHSAYADPLMMLYAVGPGILPHFMAKAELMKKPLLGPFLKWVGVFGVDRGHSDTGAIDTAIQLLERGEKIFLYPEGTRAKPGKEVRAHTGAIRIALTADAPLVPMFVPQRKRLFRRNTVVIGAPYRLEPAAADGSRVHSVPLAADLLKRIYALAHTNAVTEQGLWPDADAQPSA